MTLEWKYSTDGVDWQELSALYRAAPLGDKKAAHLQRFSLGGGNAGPELAAAVSNAGGLGFLGMGGLPAPVIREQIRATR